MNQIFTLDFSQEQRAELIFPNVFIQEDFQINYNIEPGAVRDSVTLSLWGNTVDNHIKIWDVSLTTDNNISKSLNIQVLNLKSYTDFSLVAQRGNIGLGTLEVGTLSLQNVPEPSKPCMLGLGVLILSLVVLRKAKS